MSTFVDTPFGPVDVDTGSIMGRDMFSIFNPALKATHEDGRPMIIMGVDDNRTFLLVLPDGRFAFESHHKIIMDWRFDPENDKWVDTDGVALEEPNDQV